jgi:hypothetical protein
MNVEKAMTELCVVLDKHCIGVEKSRALLALTDRQLAVVEDAGKMDRHVTAQGMLNLAKERMKKITSAKSLK